MENMDDFRSHNKETHQKAAFYWNSLANDREKKLVVTLINLATFIVSVTAGVVALSSKDFAILFTPLNKWLIVCAWVLMFFSIVLGLIQIMLDTKYFKYLSDDENSRVRIWSQSEKREDLIRGEISKLGSTKPSSGHLALIIEANLLVLGLLLILVTAISILVTK